MINNANPYFSNFLFPGAGIFLGALHHIFLFAVGSQSCFLLFPAELFPLIWGILVGQKVFFYTVLRTNEEHLFTSKNTNCSLLVATVPF